MTLEEFLKALREGEAVTGDGGETYLKRESGRLALRSGGTGEEIGAALLISFLEGLLTGDSGYEPYEKPILDGAEKRYLGSFLRPYGDRVKAVMKESVGDSRQRIVVCVAGEGGGKDDYVPLPRFPRGEMYRGMEDDRRYALKELGL